MRMSESIQTGNSQEVKMCCPFCITVIGTPDTKFHMYVNYNKKQFICFKCKSKGGLAKLRQFMEIHENMLTIVPNLVTLKSKINALFKPKKAIPRADLSLCSWSIFDPTTPIAYKYMRDRGFSDEEMERLNIRVGRKYHDPHEGKEIYKWSGRIIFPFYEEGEMVYMVGRSYVGAEPKYLNPTGGGKYLHNIDAVDGEVILCEGVTSAIAAQRVTGIPAVPALGKSLTNFQLTKLRAKARKVWVALDGTEDVTKQVRASLTRQLLKIGFEVWEVRPPNGKDPDDAQDEFPDCLARARKQRII